MAVTLLDIAKDLNVSAVTVSKVLGNKGKISAATRKRVLRRAKELNYQTNWIARSLVTRRTYVIGLLLPDSTHPFFAEIAKTVAKAIRPHGYHVMISYSEEDPRLEMSEAESLLARQVDGLIIASAQAPDRADWFERIRERKVPFVLIDRPIPGAQASFVGVDNETIGKLATTHLIAQGCRRIAHLRGPGRTGIAAGRVEGYRRALEKSGLSPSPHYIVEAGYEDDTGYEAMRKLLRARPIPDGVFCYNDPVAIGAMKAIYEAGLNVPRDIAVMGAGNVHYSDVLAVPLTTVDQGTSTTGRRAVELLVEQMGAKRVLRPKRVLIAPKLVVRESTLRLAPKSDQFPRAISPLDRIRTGKAFPPAALGRA
ncbi:MAG TPA: LacI family DNA-binding transcriptional regulator [Candidatus Acidoferrales bacterium]|jgi:LacI family transcriptional regulator|nr:LacI family DNA-binding transcriptional regulator [Candidatus Acidoferrales bacterium]